MRLLILSFLLRKGNSKIFHSSYAWNNQIKSVKANTGAFRAPVLQAVETVEPETVALVILLNLHLNAKKKVTVRDFQQFPAHQSVQQPLVLFSYLIKARCCHHIKVAPYLLL